jgi:RimJ/RimL family protein N-acetyltransferase
MELKTKRLILRPLKKSDWKDLVEGAGDFKVAKMTEKIPHPYNKKDALWFINHSIKNWKKKNKTDYIFSLELKSEKKMIGIIHLSNVDLFHKIATTGSWVNATYWKHGYITEAKIAVNEFAFNKLKLRKLNTTVFTKNLASNKTQKRTGYIKEGLKKKNSKSVATGEIRDVILYGLFKEDWKKNLSKLKKHLANKIKKLN